MADAAVVALATGVVTGLTAVTASWISGRSTLRTALAQANSSRATQKDQQKRQLRRDAYLALLDYENKMRWDLIAISNMADHGDRDAARKAVQGRNEQVRNLVRRVRVVVLEGPAEIEDDAIGLRDALTSLAFAIEGGVATANDSVYERIKPAMGELNDAVEQFLATARKVLDETG